MEKNVPAELLPAVEHQRKSFDRVSLGLWMDGAIFYYSLLNNEAVDDPTKKYLNYLMHVIAWVWPVHPLAAGRRPAEDLLAATICRYPVQRCPATSGIPNAQLSRHPPHLHLAA